MRLFLLLFAAGLAACPMSGHASSLQRDRGEQAGAYRAMQQGRVLSLTEIRARIRVPGGQYIGVEVLGDMVYRLKFMRGADVIWIDVDARTGRIVGRTGR
ncbi:MAG: hypothetical protein QOD42_2605 [Sphingomonadales bacterium]|jgi:uncharacterized membrane protein YkoI|nr:hypothetical protein [Sphingomonadales bacterium]